MRVIKASIILVSFCTSVTAAEVNMQPGLWELKTSSDLLLLAPHIPPSKMQEIEALANEYGLEMPQINDGAAVSQICITQEMASRKTLPNFYQEQAGCATKNATREGYHYKTEFSCNGSELQGSGIAEGYLTDAQHFNGQTKFTGQLQGQPINEQAQVSAKWLNASCGNVKPL